MFILTILITFMEIKNKAVNSVISISFFAVMLILLMIIFFGTFKLTEYYENQEELKLTTLKNQMLEKSMSETEQTFNLWKKSMHDYKHNIINLKILAQNKDLEGIQRYLDEEENLLSKKLFYYKTGNDTVDSIIYIKQNAAETKKIPFLPNHNLNYNIAIKNRIFTGNAISMGNPHFVIFIKDTEDLLSLAKEYGPEIETAFEFPEKTNVEFIKIKTSSKIELCVWERGCGITLACGTGACAAAIAAVLNDYCPMNEDITVKVKGGELIVNYTGDTVFLTGSAELIYDGVIEI